MVTLSRTLSIPLNRDLLIEELSIQFPTKFQYLAVSGYTRDLTKFTTGSTVTGRIGIPRTEPNVVATNFDIPIDTYQPGEIRVFFDPAPVGTDSDDLDALLAAHDWTVASKGQRSQDIDLSDISTLENLKTTPFNSLTVNQQNTAIQKLTRLVVRLYDAINLGE